MVECTNQIYLSCITIFLYKYIILCYKYVFSSNLYYILFIMELKNIHDPCVVNVHFSSIKSYSIMIINKLVMIVFLLLR